MAGTSADKLNKLKQTKADIKAAIREKGQAVSDDDTFASYADKIRAIDNDGDVEEWDGSGVVIAPPKTFTIGGTSYVMENRMTWYEWSRSDYNTDGFSCGNVNDYVYEAESSNKVTDIHGNDVLGTTVITEGAEYLIKKGA